MTKSKKTSKTRQNFDFGMEPIITLLSTYRISGIFRDGLIFAEFATTLKSQKIDTAKNKPYYKSPLRTLQIAKIGLSENLTHLPGVIFAKFSRYTVLLDHCYPFGLSL